MPKQIAELALVKSLINQLVNADALLMLHAHKARSETHSLANADVKLLPVLLAKLLIKILANADALSPALVLELF